MSHGRMTQVGTPAEVFQRPATPFVAAFIGSTPMNLLPGQITSGTLHVAGATLPAPAGIAGGDLVYGARPEYLELLLQARPDAFPGTVSVLENLGTSTLVTLGTDDALIQAVVPEGEEPPIGAPAWALPRRSLLYRDGRLL
ncbi:TOBE domain-containing protein [Nonomuraea sp. NPDC049028]|uniref:TOBE domain-containing protein n=1 Tax=Nonomuraea sp. NPDC049028 TaxID=3364348 RepID=UPI0037221D43